MSPYYKKTFRTNSENDAMLEASTPCSSFAAAASIIYGTGMLGKGATVVHGVLLLVFAIIMKNAKMFVSKHRQMRRTLNALA